jgi:hypothetical protein
MRIKTITSSLFLLLLCSTTIQADALETRVTEKVITANEWQSVQQQIINAGNFLDDAQRNEEEKGDDGSIIPDRTVLSGTFGLTDYIKPFNTDTGDQFGFDMALSGNLMVVGARFEDSNGLGPDGSPLSNNLINSGAAYVFRRGSGGWQQEAYLKASNAGANDEFGRGLAVEGDLIVIGAREEDSSTTGINSIPNNSAPGSGAAYVFERIDGVWQETAYLKASNTGSSDRFGSSIDIEDRTIVVGAQGEASSTDGINPGTNNSSPSAGAVYVFTEVDGEWQQQAFIKASNSDASDHFGADVSLSGDTLIVGSRFEDSGSVSINGSQSNSGGRLDREIGAAYVFVREGEAWTQQAYLKAPNSALNDRFGNSVAVFGDVAVVGAQTEESASTGVNGNLFNDSAPDSGAAYVFRRNRSGVWRFVSYLKAPNTGIGDEYGFSVDISNSFIVVSAQFEDSSMIELDGSDDNNFTDAGAAYVYQIVGDDIELISTLKSSTPGSGDSFGITAALSGTGIAVAAYREDSNATGVNNDSNNNDALDSGSVNFYQTISTFHTISGVITGLADGNKVTLQNSEGDIITVTGNGEFRFPGLFVEGESYEVIVAENGFPVNPHQSCEIENSSGILDSTTVGTILVRCTLRTLSINQNINTVNQAAINVPVQLAPEGVSLSGVEFTLDYDADCLNPDADNDGELDNISFNVSNDFTTSIIFDPNQSDGEIDVVVSDLSLPFSALNAGDLLNIEFTVDCPGSQNTDLLETPVAFSQSNRPSFSDLAANVVEGTVQDGAIRVWAGITGDCDVSGAGELTVADLGRLVLEIADGDGTNFIDAPESDNFGSPQGCDANSNQEINVADLTCLTRLLGDNNCETIRVATTALPEVNLSTETEEDLLWIQARMAQKGNVVSGFSFSLDINPFALHTPSVDFNHDGIPDRLRFNQDLQTPPNVLWNEKTNRLDVFMANVNGQSSGAEAVLPLPEGLLMEVGIPLSDEALAAFEVLENLPPVFADIGGMEVTGVVSVGDVIFKDTFE